MKRLTVCMAVFVCGMIGAFVFGKYIHADHNGHNDIILDTSSMPKIENDLQEAIRINGILVNPSQVWSGSGHKIEIFVPSKNGIYTLKGNISDKKITLSEITKVVGSGTIDDYDVHTAKGMIGSILVEYEALPYGAD